MRLMLNYSEAPDFRGSRLRNPRSLRLPGLLAALLALAALVSPPARGQSAKPQVVSSNRFLCVFDISKPARRQLPALLQATQEILDSRASGQLHYGDTLGVWSFDSDIHSGYFPLQRWLPGEEDEIALRIGEFLKRQPVGKKSRLDRAMEGVLEVVRNSETIIVFIFSTGESPMKGTPFDQDINSAYKQALKGMTGDRMPIITVLQGRRGRLVKWTVNALPWPVVIPELPIPIKKPKALASTGPAPLPQNPGPSTENGNAAVAPTPKPAPQAPAVTAATAPPSTPSSPPPDVQPQTSSTAPIPAAPAPTTPNPPPLAPVTPKSSVPVAQTASAGPSSNPPDQPPVANSEQSALPPSAPLSVPTPPAKVQPQSRPLPPPPLPAVQSPAQAASGAPAMPTPPKAPEMPPPPGQPPALNPVAQPKPPAPPPTPTPTPSSAPKPPASSPAVQPAMAVTPVASRPWTLLAGAAVLFVMAGVLLALRLRRGRVVSGPSLITRSMNNVRK